MDTLEITVNTISRHGKATHVTLISDTYVSLHRKQPKANTVLLYSLTLLNNYFLVIIFLQLKYPTYQLNRKNHEISLTFHTALLA